MIDIIMDVIRMLNDGNIIPMQEDKNTKIDLYHDKVQLYMDTSGLERKYYYFAELDVGEDMQDNLAQIEEVALSSDAYTIFRKPEPSNSYMILFWKVKNIDENLYPYIIQIEENEFFYKKYVFYYTEKEQKDFIEWCESLNNFEKPMLDTVLEEIKTLHDESEQVHFFTRLLSKVPFFNPVFPKAVMNDFDKMVSQKINGIRKKKGEVEMINNIFISSIEQENFDVEVLSNMIYKKIMEV